MKSQSGSAIVMLFVAVALFGALAYAFMKGSRGSTSMMTEEQSKANSSTTQGQAMIVSQAVKRLKLRGCKDAQISYETPSGANPNPQAPTDGRCHVYRVNGGGIQFVGADVVPSDPCTTGAIGAVCSDSAIYIGSAGGNRIYAQAADASPSAQQWKTVATPTPGSTSNTDGKANTDAMAAEGIDLHPAAALCRSSGPQWYLPAKDELNLLWVNSTGGGGTLNLVGMGVRTSMAMYWTSTESNVWNDSAYVQQFGTGVNQHDNKTLIFPHYVRCVRQ